MATSYQWHIRTQCCVPDCGTRLWKAPAQSIYCAAHEPLPAVVDAEQPDLARRALRRRGTLAQAASLAGARPQDVDVALWHRLGQPMRPEPMF